MFCREQVAQLRRRIDDIHAAGAELYVIGNGTPNFIAGFRENTGYDGPLYVDPSLEVYKRAGMKRSVASVLNPKVLLHGARALSRGKMQGRTQGDSWQQGGTLVIAPDGAIKYAYHSSEAGDHAPTAEIIAALR
jgi:peroxiredoxin